MFDDAASVFAALGDETRLRLVARLHQGGAQSITALTDGTGVSRQAVTKHLRVLAQAGIAYGKKAGRQRVWSVRPERLSEAQQYISQISAEWDARMARLQALVED